MKKILIAASAAVTFALPLYAQDAKPPGTPASDHDRAGKGSASTSPGINITQFWFHCKADEGIGNVITEMKSFCDGKQSCSFICNLGQFTLPGDPCVGVTKVCKIKYSCGDNTITKAFNESGNKVEISCDLKEQK